MGIGPLQYPDVQTTINQTLTPAAPIVNEYVPPQPTPVTNVQTGATNVYVPPPQVTIVNQPAPPVPPVPVPIPVPSPATNNNAPACPTGKPNSPCVAIGTDGRAVVPPEWCLYLAGVKEGTLQFDCLTPTETWAWGQVAGGICSPEPTPAPSPSPVLPPLPPPNQPSPPGKPTWALPSPPDWSTPAIGGAIKAILGAFKAVQGNLAAQFGFGGTFDAPTGPAWFDAAFPGTQSPLPYQSARAEIQASLDSGEVTQVLAAFADVLTQQAGLDLGTVGLPLRQYAWLVITSTLNSVGALFTPYRPLQAATAALPRLSRF